MLEGFATRDFSHDGKTRPVYRRGQGPGVLIMHEIPGITPQVARFATWVADAGFTVVMPSLFGTPGKPLSRGYLAREFARACVSREFRVLAAHQSSPITDWLRALCRATHAELGGPGMGALGMCLTGNFALSLMMEPFLLAPVLSQPSLPLPVSPGHRRALHLSPAEEDNLRRRAAEGVPVLGLRFDCDPMCPRARFDTLRRTLGDRFESIELACRDANPYGNRPPHSVLTTDLVDAAGHPTKEAAERVIAFFNERLNTAPQPN